MLKSPIPKAIVIVVLTLAVVGAHHYTQALINRTYNPPTPTQTSVQKVVQPNAFFYSGVVAKRDQTQVSITYSLGDYPHVMYLDLVMPEASESLTRLITHPLLTLLPWQYIEEDGVRLYQKSKTLDTLAQLKQQPPLRGTLLADPQLLLTAEFKVLQAKPLNEFASLEGIEYILTTYTPSQPQGNGYRYQTFLDASDALVNLKNELVWHLRIPTATAEHPLYLGGVEVNYQ